MITNSVFVHISEIGTVCDEIDVRVVSGRDRAVIGICVHGSQIAIEEILKDPGTEAASEPGAVWSESRVRPYIVDEPKNQVGIWVDRGDVSTGLGSVLVDRIKDQVSGDLGMSPSNFEPETKICERFLVVLVG